MFLNLKNEYFYCVKVKRFPRKSAREKNGEKNGGQIGGKLDNASSASASIKEIEVRGGGEKMSAHFTPFLSRSFSSLGKLRGVWGGMKFASEIALLQLHFDGFSTPPKCLANFPVAFLPKRIIIIIGWDDSCGGGKSQREKKSCHRKPLLFLFLVFERTRQLEEEGKLRLEIDDDNFFFQQKVGKEKEH